MNRAWIDDLRSNMRETQTQLDFAIVRLDRSVSWPLIVIGSVILITAGIHLWFSRYGIGAGLAAAAVWIFATAYRARCRAKRLTLKIMKRMLTQ